MNEIYIGAAVGGVLIGLASALPLWWHGRVAGASGLLSDLISNKASEKRASALYLLGLIAGAGFLLLLNAERVSSSAVVLDAKLVLGALLVGYGARLGSGCTSGHGICGMARFSRRSIVATAIFLSVAMLTATVLRAFI